MTYIKSSLQPHNFVLDFNRVPASTALFAIDLNTINSLELQRKTMKSFETQKIDIKACACAVHELYSFPMFVSSCTLEFDKMWCWFANPNCSR